MKILNKLTCKHLKMNPKRTIVTIVGVMLSTALMVGIGLLFSSVRHYLIQSNIESTGNWHLRIDHVNANKMNLVEHNVDVETYYYGKPLGFSLLENSGNEYKPYLYLEGLTKDGLQDLHLLSGKLPKKEDEVVISSHIATNGDVNYEVGDVLTLNYGPRQTTEGETYDNVAFDEEKDSISVKDTKQYTIVGIVDRSSSEDYSAAGYSIFTYLDHYEKEDMLRVTIRFKNPSSAYKKGDLLLKNLGNSMEDSNYNDSLLSVYGASRYENITSGLRGLILIILTIISIGCIVVIYNGFAISVMERKKQFGLFSSIGATKKQIRHTVFFEAVVVGLIGIPLGILGAYLGIGIVIFCINHLIPFAFDGIPLTLVTYPFFLIVPILFMIITLLASAFIPAYRASRITPIEAIRQNDDIKIKGKKLKTRKWVRKIFGIEGELAYKNMKRNKKKYRITVASLFISIVMFISFSSLLNYGIKASNESMELPNYDIMVSLYDSDWQKIDRVTLEILQNEDIAESTVFRRNNYEISYDRSTLTSQAKKHMKNSSYYVALIILSNEDFQTYAKENGLKDTSPILYNKKRDYEYKVNQSRKVYNYQVFQEDPTLTLYSNYCDSEICDDPLQTISVQRSDQPILGMYDSELSLVVNEDFYQTLFQKEQAKISGLDEDSLSQEIYIKVNDTYEHLDKSLSKLSEKGLDYAYYNNVKESIKEERNLILVLQILLYGFIALVTLIGVTSVFNTIHTSVSLRRKEFAMLRSMGLSPKGFNKVLYFESFFVGMKALLYGIPVSLFVTYLIYCNVDSIVSFDQILIPVKSILLAIFGVFIIVLISMMYASRKIKKENILDALREENI